MNPIRLLRHPARTASLVHSRATAPLHRRRTRSQVQALCRDHVERCWCGGELGSFSWHPSYGVCTSCGGYVNRRPPAAEALSELYSLEFYWHGRVRTKGQPPIERRAGIDRSDGRVDYWVSLIERFAPEAKQVLEVGCGSGVLLAELAGRGYSCVGVEPDERTAAWTQEQTGVEIRSGLFPFEGLPQSDLFLAFDVLEHARDPQAFVQGAADALRPGGVAIIQTPIDRYADLQPPFGNRSRDAFDDVEHCFLFTDDGMRRLAESTGLEVRSLDERLWLHHEICVFVKPLEAAAAGALKARAA